DQDHAPAPGSGDRADRGATPLRAARGDRARVGRRPGRLSGVDRQRNQRGPARMMLLRRLRMLLLAATLLGGAAQAAGVDPDELLPIEQAFRLSAQASDRGRIEIRFDVADGYYLYRHRMGASAEGFDAVEARWPDGIPHVDEFFGEVE